MNYLVLLPKVAQASQDSLGDLSQVLLTDLTRLLDDQVKAPPVHVLHADVDLPITIKRKTKKSYLKIWKPVESSIKAHNVRRVALIQDSQFCDDLLLDCWFNLFSNI